MGLPPKLLIQTGRFVWSTMWATMMKQMAPSDSKGRYQRPDSQFRGAIASGSEVNGRYTLLVGMGCPWAHRTLLTRAIKGLQSVIDVVVVQPSPEDGGWIFADDRLGWKTVREFYLSIDSRYDGRCTVPVLWDRQEHSIINNESAEIIEMLNGQLNDCAENAALDLYPADRKAEIDDWNQRIYEGVNNGVYQCGFAQTQSAYDEACDRLFETLDKIEAVLEHQRFLLGSTLTLADIRLFPTIFRFDSVYYSLFKCNRRAIRDYPALSAYLRDLYQYPGVAETCDVEQVKKDYFGNLFPLNPGGLIPQGPDMSYLSKPHGRESMV